MYKFENPITNMPWLDIRIEDECMKHLWNIINIPSQAENNKYPLAGNISKSVFVDDKDNIFYENVLKKLSEFMFFRNWENYFFSHIANSKPHPIFKINRIWVNYQKKHEFNPPHKHDGLFSFVVFMKIPTHWEQQHALSFSANSNSSCASDFQFLLGKENGVVEVMHIPLSPKDEGRMLFFPAWLNHQVFPFYGTEEERVTISGNIEFFQDLKRTTNKSIDNMEKQLEKMEYEVEEVKKIIQKSKDLPNKFKEKT